MSVSRQLRSYVSSVSWLLRDAARGNRGRVVTVVLLNTLGALALAASFGGVVLLAQAMETGKPLAGQELTTARMIGAALIVVLIAIASGWLLYASEWMIARIAIEYQVHTARRIMRIVADPKHKGWPSLATGRPRRYVNGLAGLTCKIAALMVRLTLRSIYSAILLVAASVALGSRLSEPPSTAGKVSPPSYATPSITVPAPSISTTSSAPLASENPAQT